MNRLKQRKALFMLLGNYIIILMFAVSFGGVVYAYKTYGGLVEKILFLSVILLGVIGTMFWVSIHSIDKIIETIEQEMNDKISWEKMMNEIKTMEIPLESDIKNSDKT